MGMGLWKIHNITFWTRIGVKQHATDLMLPILKSALFMRERMSRSA